MRNNYHAIWLRELRAGKNGQRLERPSTWQLDGLWSAACLQLRATETEALLGSALDNGAHVTFIAGLLRDVENAWNRAHLAYLGEKDGNRHVA